MKKFALVSLILLAGSVLAGNAVLGQQWSALSSGIGGEVRALAWGGSNLYAGGYFGSAGGVSASRIAKWDGSAWSPLGPGMNRGVEALAWDGSNLYAGGVFLTAGVLDNSIRRWDGSSWSALGSEMSSNVTALA